MLKNQNTYEKRLLTLEDMRNIVFISSPEVSTDGKKIAYVQYHTDKNTGDFIPHVCEINGEKHDKISENIKYTQSQPAFSPDGKKLAYISDQTGENQIWIKEYEKNGENFRLTSMRHGIESFVWSPDSNYIAFVSRVWTDEQDEDLFSEMTDDENRIWTNNRSNNPIEIEELMYKFDETYGIVDGSKRHIGVADLKSKKMTMLTKGKVNYDMPVWSPDGKLMAFYGKPYEHADAVKPELYIMELGDGKINQITNDSPFYIPYPVVFTRDGKSIIYSGAYEEKTKVIIPKLFKMSVDGENRECLFPDEEVCHGISPLSIGVTVYGKEIPPYKLSECGKYIYFLSGWNSCTHVYRVNIDKEHKIEQITFGDISVNSFCAPVNKKMIYSRADTMNLTDLYCYDLLSGHEARLTYSNDWMENIIMQKPEEMWIKTKDNSNIHGWVLPPAVVEKSSKYPAVLDIHGGPTAYYAAGWNFEFQMLSAAGYAVVYCDPRGSAGYGHEFSKSEHAWSKTAYSDLMEYLDKAIEKYDFIDPKKLGVTGGSYGGWMTNKIIGYTKRFKAAVTQRTFSNPATSYGTGDMGFVSGAAEKPKSFLDYMIDRVRNGTITAIDEMTTPLLILHGEKDYRCTLEQGEQIFAAMKDRHSDIPVRMAIFPGENHGVTRTGKIHNQIGHLAEMIEWFDKYLRGNIICTNCGNKPYWIFDDFGFRCKSSSDDTARESPCELDKEDLSIHTLDGKGEIKGIIVKPESFEKDKKYPAMLYLNRDLSNSCAGDARFEFKKIACEKIAVIAVNVREGNEYCDLLHFINEAVKKYGWIDKNRLGVFGIGDGAHESIWLISHSEIFKAAVVYNGTYNNLIKYASSNRAGMISSKFYVNFTDFMLEQIKTSPVSYTDNINIPVLIMHDIKKAEYPVEEAHQLFVSLKDQHKNLPVKMMLYPNDACDFEDEQSKNLLTWLKKYL